MELSKKHYNSPRLTNEILDCSMPMTFDQYNNCGYYCLYCFSTFQRDIRGNPGSLNYAKRNEVKAVSVPLFKKKFSPEYRGVFKYLIDNRKPMQWGGLSDPFCPLEEQFGVGLEILKFLSEIKYPVSFSSKSDLLIRNADYWNAFMDNKENYHYKSSIITLNDKIHPALEANTPTPQRRFETLEKLSKAGVETTLRLRPFIIGISDVDSVKMAEMAAKAGVKSISTEFFCLEQRANGRTRQKYAQLSRLCGFDVMKFYKETSITRGYLRLNPRLKYKYLKPLKDACDKYGLRLHVSDAHHKELSCTGSCCGLPDNHPTLSNYNKSQFTNAIVIAKKNGSVRFSEITEDFDWLASFKWNVAIHAKGVDESNRKKWTMYQYMRNAWNNPKDGHSPYRYFGGALQPDGKDKNGDIIYKYVGVWNENSANTTG